MGRAGTLAAHARVAILATALAVATWAAWSAAARADGPGIGTASVASLGDSYISGEAGRWAGNTNEEESWIDALGTRAYYDNEAHTAEKIAGCHRSLSAEIYIGGGVNSVNLACSSAKTSTFTTEEAFKPGIDFYSSGANRGQALMLEEYARTHNVKMVVLSIGGNNFNFASIVQDCIEDWLTSPSWWQNHCDDDSEVTANFTRENVATQTAAIKGAVQNIHRAMVEAGYGTEMYAIVVQDYESPIPTGSGFRYPEEGWERQEIGGCGFWNADANWANEGALPTIDAAVHNGANEAGYTNVKLLLLGSAFNSRRLCESTVGLLEERGLTSWRNAGAVDRTEWVNQVRTVTALFGEYELQEDFHPNYWGQLALRNCVRQAYNSGTPRGGTCTRTGTGLTAGGEPVMTLR
ncbi:MAG TPA: hypothetical protein VN635_08260 [Conexibacter sp.]|nr:hypothetical protein [Conexibacter sp.]